MNGEYFQNPMFSNQNMMNNIPNNSFNNVEANSYIEDILKNNKGKKINISTIIPNSKEEMQKTFNGILEQTGKDYLIISNPEDGKYYLIPIIYLNYIKFDEKINI